MPRTKQPRKIVAPPKFKGYKPYGYFEKTSDAIELLYEEYEALKLTDYDSMHHQDAARLMGISRATFARIYESARQKIAKAFVETKEIKTVYGNVHFDTSWFICDGCYARFTQPLKTKKIQCPICKSFQVKNIKEV